MPWPILVRVGVQVAVKYGPRVIAVFKGKRALEKANQAKKIAERLEKAKKKFPKQKGDCGSCKPAKLRRVSPTKKDRKKMSDRERAKNKDGKLRDPNTKQEIKGDKWDAGHKPGYEDKAAREIAKKMDVTDPQWREYNKGIIDKQMRPEIPASNRSHKFEFPWD